MSEEALRVCDANHSNKSGCHSITRHDELEPPNPCKIKAFRGFLASIYHEVCMGLTRFPNHADLSAGYAVTTEGKILLRSRGSTHTTAINSANSGTL